MSKKKVFEPVLDTNMACSIAQSILEAFDGKPMEQTKTILNGMVTASTIYAHELSKHVVEQGSVERLVLSWLLCGDTVFGMEFGKYINLPKEESNE